MFFNVFLTPTFVERFCRNILSKNVCTFVERFVDTFVPRFCRMFCQVRSGQVRPSQVRPGQVRSAQAKPGQAMPGQVRSVQVQVRPAQVRSINAYSYNNICFYIKIYAYTNIHCCYMFVYRSRYICRKCAIQISVRFKCQNIVYR